MSELEFSTFLQKQNLTQDQWDKANIEWVALENIADNFESRKNELEQAATSISAILQKQKSVHSVRWRVKDTAHLLAKIVRKRAEGEQKYADIDATNYDVKITDLVGVRVLHLFKEDWAAIQQFIDDSWHKEEGPIAYHRQGDKLEQYEILGCETKEHDAGYRSIHSIITNRLQKREIKIEIQVRTVFEEGWSEIDHQVRYPNFSDNEIVAYFLNIFNGLSGFADEMGTFVKKLAKEISINEKLAVGHEQICNELDSAENEKKQQMRQLEELAKENAEMKEALNKFKAADQKVESSTRSISHIDNRNFGKNTMERALAALSTPSATGAIERAIAASVAPSANDTIGRALAAFSTPSATRAIDRAIAASEVPSSNDTMERALAALSAPSATEAIERAIAASVAPSANDSIRRAIADLKTPRTAALDNPTEEPQSISSETAKKNEED
ncbi:TPA: RelA/SpoT domain-containing protein [Vibrio alginolyticus]